MSDDGSIVIGTVYCTRTIQFTLDGRRNTFIRDAYYPWIWREGVGIELLSTVLTTEYGVDLSGWILDGEFGELTGMTPDGSRLVGHAKRLIDGQPSSSFSDAMLISFIECLADLDGSGEADIFDLLAYLDVWFAGDLAADLTDEDPPVVDIFDLLVYLDAWFAGCE